MDIKTNQLLPGPGLDEKLRSEAVSSSVTLICPHPGQVEDSTAGFLNETIRA